MEYQRQSKAQKTIQNNRMKFANKMDTLLVLNTNVITKRLYRATKQHIEATLSRQGEFSANCQLLDYLAKFDSGAIDLLEAFREIEYKGPHHYLALILQEGISGETTGLLGSAQETSYKKIKKNSCLSHPQQASSDEVEVKTPVESSQCPENQLSELASFQQNATDTGSTTCNATNQQEISAPDKKSHCDMNKRHTVKDKGEKKSKEIHTLLASETCDGSQNEESCTRVASEPMSESFMISETRIRQVFNYRKDDVEHEIDDLKHAVENPDEETFLKEENIGEGSCNYRKNGVENENDAASPGCFINIHSQTVREEEHKEETSQSIVSVKGEEPLNKCNSDDGNIERSLINKTDNCKNKETSFHMNGKVGESLDKGQRKESSDMGAKKSEPLQTDGKKDYLQHIDGSIPRLVDSGAISDYPDTPSGCIGKSKTIINMDQNNTLISSIDDIDTHDRGATSSLDENDIISTDDESVNNAINSDSTPLLMGRLQSCPARLEVDEEEEEECGDRRNPSNSLQRTTNHFQRCESLPIQGAYSSSIFSQLCAKRQIRACKGIAGNM